MDKLKELINNDDYRKGFTHAVLLIIAPYFLGIILLLIF